MIIRESKRVIRSKIESELGKDATGSQVLDYLFGNRYNDYMSNGDYFVKEWETDKRKWWQRLNMVWAMPLTLLVMPFQWVLYGYTGWSSKSIIGTFILKVTGHLK